MQAYAQALSILDRQRARSSQPEFDRQARREQKHFRRYQQIMLSRGDGREISSGINISYEWIILRVDCFRLDHETQFLCHGAHVHTLS